MLARVDLGLRGCTACMQDMIAAATDTTAVALEWAMAELAHNPRVMGKVQDEIARVSADAEAEQPTAIGEAELNRMCYLKAVVKEVFRLHPPLPLLLPRESMTAAAVQGGRYEVPAKTALLVNAWAIGRDPAAWDAPEEFRPERFLAGSGSGSDGQASKGVDLRGTDYQLLPFGTGRRICPGINFALPALELAGARARQPPAPLRLGAPQRHAAGGHGHGRGAGALDAAAGAPCARPQVEAACLVHGTH